MALRSGKTDVLRLPMGSASGYRTATASTTLERLKTATPIPNIIPVRTTKKFVLQKTASAQNAEWTSLGKINFRVAFAALFFTSAF